MVILLALLFSMVGVLVLKLAKNAGSMSAAMLGAALIGYSYFVWDAAYIAVIGIMLTGLSLVILQRGG